jgi:1-aminocyclopropane-1-carboxylate deaminase/D-cysteine desulfhydrase-like pyridoxal-dependent ACC family enzyme
MHIYRFDAYLTVVLALLLQIIVASGTGTMAYFLAQYFSSRNSLASTIFPESADPTHHLPVEVLAVPCVSSAWQLQAQIDQLSALCGHSPDERKHGHPTILTTDHAPRRVFAKPAQELLGIWQALQQQSGIDFDLIYAPRAFEIILSHCTSAGVDGDYSLRDWLPGANVLYYHCGGTEGNESQLQRYERLGFLATK